MTDQPTAKLCECGCGKPAPIAKKTARRIGHIKGEPVRFIQNHRPRSPETCSIEGCCNPHDSRGWCSTHWRRWKLYGDPLALKSPKPYAERITEKIKIDSVSGCWVWTDSLNSAGYGRIYFQPKGKPVLAHRLAYELFVGPVLDCLVLDHICRVRACVNPQHLEPVTFTENVRRGDAVKTQCPRGHPYDAENTGISNGGKRCLTCHRERQRDYYHRTKSGAV